MAPKKLLAAAVLALLGLTGAMLEASFVHTDDGCVVETHCNACLLRLRTPGSSRSPSRCREPSSWSTVSRRPRRRRGRTPPRRASRRAARRSPEPPVETRRSCRSLSRGRARAGIRRDSGSVVFARESCVITCVGRPACCWPPAECWHCRPPRRPPGRPAGATTVASAGDDVGELRRELETLRQDYASRIAALEARLQALEGSAARARTGAGAGAEPGSARRRAPRRSSTPTSPRSATSSGRPASRREAGSRRSTCRRPELAFQAVVDPYARADFFVTLGPDEVALEEGYITFPTLPGGLLDEGRQDARRVRQGERAAPAHAGVHRPAARHDEPHGRRGRPRGRRHLGRPPDPEPVAVPGGDGAGLPGQLRDLQGAHARRPRLRRAPARVPGPRRVHEHRPRRLDRVRPQRRHRGHHDAPPRRRRHAALEAAAPLDLHAPARPGRAHLEPGRRGRRPVRRRGRLRLPRVPVRAPLDRRRALRQLRARATRPGCATRAARSS